MAGILSEAPPPETGVLESLWKERSVPAHLLTRDPSLAKAAADKGIRVLLLEPKDSTSDPSPQEEEEEEKKGQEGSIVSVHEWAEIPKICPCGTRGEWLTCRRKTIAVFSRQSLHGSVPVQVPSEA